MPLRARLGALLVFAIASLPPAPANAAAVGAPADSVEAAAARRRAEILRAPYARSAERRALRTGELVVSFDAGVPLELRDDLSRDLSAFVSALVDHDGWPRPFSPRSQLLVLFSAGPGVTGAGWDGRDQGGTLRSPVVIVAATRARGSALADAAAQVAMLSLRQGSPGEASWAVEGVAAWLARRTLSSLASLASVGAPASPAAGSVASSAEVDPLLGEAGALTQPAVLAAFLETLERRLPRGALDVREAWEAAAERGGESAESFLRDVASRSGAESLGARLAEIVAARLVAGPTNGAMPALARRAWLLGDLASPAPAPLGWRRVALRTEGERAGLEISVPEAAAHAARLLLFYRDGGGFDSLAARPGQTRVVPGAGTSSIQIVLADGDGGPEAPLRVRRVPDYPAALVSARAGRVKDGVEIAWETSRHRSLLGWVIERTDETEPESSAPLELVRDTLPAARESESATGYFWLDRDAVPGRSYRYRILALTEEGLLGEAFEASVAGR